MRPFMTSLLIAILSVSTFATNYTITSGYFNSKTFDNSDTLLMTGGGGDTILGKGSSVLDIRNTTSPFIEGVSGINYITLKIDSQLHFSGGHVNRLNVGDRAASTISGGQINGLSIYRDSIYVNSVELIVRDYNYNAITKILTGTWQNYSTFQTQIVDGGVGYPSTFSHLGFTIVPEPTTLLFLGIGGLLIRRK